MFPRDWPSGGVGADLTGEVDIVPFLKHKVNIEKSMIKDNIYKEIFR